MSKIVSIGTATPAFKHEQPEILRFMERIYALPETEKRKLRFLYHQSGIRTRHSVMGDYSRASNEWKFYSPTENLEPFPSLEQRMEWYNRHAAPLSVDAIRHCIAGRIRPREITHLITVSCTGMSAPGLDLQVAELMDLPKNIFRTSVNFMGCYAAIHGLKLADALCNSTPGARVMVVCTELCTLHFQREPTPDNMMSSMLFADGSAAALVVSDDYEDTRGKALHLGGFYSEIIPSGKKDMAWELSSTGFRMTLSGYIPDLIEEDFAALVERALESHSRNSKTHSRNVEGYSRNAGPDPGNSGPDESNDPHADPVTHWCVHPGGRKILDSIAKAMRFEPSVLTPSYEVLSEYGNMSSPTILFVLRKILHELDFGQPNTVFGAAFGPGLTMETFIAKT